MERIIAYFRKHGGYALMKELKAGKILEAQHVVAAAVVEVDKHNKTKVHQHGRGGVGAAAGIMAGEALALNSVAGASGDGAITRTVADEMIVASADRAMSGTGGNLVHIAAGDGA